jgi:hypothetical protein
VPRSIQDVFSIAIGRALVNLLKRTIGLVLDLVAEKENVKLIPQVA